MRRRPGSDRSLHEAWPTQLDVAAGLPASLRRAARRLLGLDELARLHRRLPSGLDAARFARAALELLEVRVDVETDSLGRIPHRGPVVFVCNHPQGALDGLVTLATLSSVRHDLRVLANCELAAIAELAPVLLPIDPYGRQGASARNAAALRRALRWLRDGGCVLLFPAGQVARFDLRTGRCSDAPWRPAVGRWLRLAGVPIVPLHIEGSNSVTFHVLSMVHPALGTVLLPRELLRARGRSVALRIGTPVYPEDRAAKVRDEDFLGQLRLRVELLSDRAGGTRRADGQASPAAGVHGVQAARVRGGSGGTAETHRAEIARLPREALLVRSGALAVYRARAVQIPTLLLEIGRLRERTFRAIGEGTGSELDLDLFDNYYDQLILWDDSSGEVVGGYRLGRVDEIRRTYGSRGLYTHTLFDYQEPLLRLLEPALELGRSFVREEWQRSYAPLLLLWRGIGEYVAREPRYCRLLGPVSISRSYGDVARDVLVEWLRTAHFEPWLGALVRPRHRYRGSHVLRALGPRRAGLDDIEGLSSLIAALEPDGKGVPVLLRHYLRLGGRILGFNVDPAFSNAIDCLLLLDLRHTDRAVLRKYVSPEGLQRFEAVHGPRIRRRRSA